MEILLTLVLGAMVGLSSALLGLGGNIIIVPLLPMITDISLPSTIATGIFAVLIVTSVNVLMFYRQKLLDVPLVFTLLPVTAGSSYLSSFFSHLVPEAYIKILFLLVMSAMVVGLLKPRTKKPQSKPHSPILLYIAGIFSGFLGGLTGIGIGVILGPMLLTTTATDERKVSPTINALILTACIFASLNYLSWRDISYPQMGHVRIDLALYLAGAAVFTAKYGRQLNGIISTRQRKIAVSSTLVALCIKTVMDLHS